MSYNNNNRSSQGRGYGNNSGYGNNQNYSQGSQGSRSGQAGYQTGYASSQCDSGYGSNQGYSESSRYSGQSNYGGESVARTNSGCARNGMEGANARYSVNWGNNHPDNMQGSVSGRQTNNRAHLQAAETAINQARSRGDSSVTVETNSEYVIRGHTEWMNKWEQNGWKTSSGRPVQNQQDFKNLDNASRGIDVTYKKVSNTGNRGYNNNNKY